MGRASVLHTEGSRIVADQLHQIRRRKLKMRFEGRTIIYENLIDSKTGENLRMEIGPDEDIELVKKGLKKLEIHLKDCSESNILA